MKKIIRLFFLFIILYVTSSLSAQGHLVSNSFAIGYSGSILNINNKGHLVNTFGITLLRTIDVYRGVTTVEGKQINITGATAFIRKNAAQDIFPAVSFAVTEIEKDFYAGFGVDLVCQIISIDGSNLKIIPKGTANIDRDKWEFSGGADLSISGELLNDVIFYLEPGINFGESLSWNMEIGLVFQYGKTI